MGEVNSGVVTFELTLESQLCDQFREQQGLMGLGD